MREYLHGFSGLKMGVLGQIGKGVVQYWPQWTFYFWEFLHLCQFC